MTDFGVPEREAISREALTACVQRDIREIRPMKWSFIDRPDGGCIISDVSTAGRIIALLPPLTRKQGGQEQVRAIAQAIVLAHNEAIHP